MTDTKAPPPTAAEQRASAHAATSGFDFEKLQSYFNLVDSVVVSLARILGVVHEVAGEGGTVTPVAVTQVASDINALANNAAASGIAPVAASEVSRLAAVAANHAAELVRVGADVQGLASRIAATESNITKALEILADLPTLVDDVQAIREMVKGGNPAGGSHA